MTYPEAASERIASHLRDAILNGEIAPGEWIRQAEVAERLGASRLPVREALRILQAEGLADYEANRGSRVPKLGMHEVEVLYQMRERLEPLALIESIPQLSADQLDRLAKLQARIEDVTDVREFVMLDREFHLLTYAGCAISHLHASILRMWNSTQYYRRAFVTITGPSRQWVIMAEHRLLLDAITRQDAVDAERYLSGHIRRTRIELSRHPEVFG
ncbi:MAG: GntR family transcriptional regulator [Streptosporangiaceae bacterium]